jgi:hypothetical protein
LKPTNAEQVALFGFDLDADANRRIDNAFGRLFSALIQAAGSETISTLIDSEDEASANRPMYLIQLQSADPALRQDSNLSVTLFATRSGTDGTIVIDDTQLPARFFGALAAGRFESEHPFFTKRPVTLPLRLRFGSSDFIEPPLQGAHIQFDVSGDGLALSGALQGSIRMSDIQTVFVGGFARLLTARIEAEPDSTTSSAIRGIFDRGGCTNPDGSVAQANDNIIDVCEVATNTLIVTLLAPDIKIFDDDGRYAPGKGSHRDCLTCGVGFTATRATV